MKRAGAARRGATGFSDAVKTWFAKRHAENKYIAAFSFATVRE
jgi:hypothetical protein